MSTNAFQKRLKRHVVGRLREYFAVTSPGLEGLCRKELQSILPKYGNPESTAGGVLFKGRLDDCMQANLQLRTANRILMRVATFKALSFAQLQNKITKVPWELYSFPDTKLKIQTTTHHCRLHHTGAIAERFVNGIQSHFGRPAPPADGTVQQLFIRGVDDRFTVSLDSSGTLLYRRGLKSHAARAPLRETAAAAALMLARYKSSETLLDPMCGSGTFALEGAMQMMGIPPGWYREFAFNHWPAFKSEHWHYLRQQSAPPPGSHYRARVIAADADSEACVALGKCISRFDLTPVVTVINKDFFELGSQSAGQPPGLLVLNPPYGRRLASAVESDRLFEQIINKLHADYRHWKFCLVVPRRQLIRSIPFKFKVRRFFHGGLKIYMTYGRVD